MNKDQFFTLLDQPHRLDAASLPELEKLCSNYPYFLAGRMLLLKNLKILDDLSFKRQLHHISAGSSRRASIFWYLEQHSEVEVESEDKSLSVSVSSEESEGESGNGSGSSEESEGESVSLSSEVEVESGSLSVSVSVRSEVEDEDESGSLSVSSEGNEKGKVIAGRYSSRIRSKLLTLVTDHKTHGLDYFDTPDYAGSLDYFSRYLQDEPPASPKKPHSSHEEELIDRFLADKPGMKAANQANPPARKENLSVEPEDQDVSFMTETLARIYLNQGLYEKAIAAYNKLSLNYPEKSVYFANQIKKIEELKNQSNL